MRKSPRPQAFIYGYIIFYIINQFADSGNFKLL